jgi:hypothetical protein
LDASGIAVIFANGGETESAAMERHFRDHPEDLAKSQAIFVSFVRS